MLAPVVNCPALIRKAVDSFKDLLGSTTEYQSFVSALCAAIFGICGYSDTVRYLMFSPSVSSIFNFFHTKELLPKLSRRHRLMVRNFFVKMQDDPTRFVYVLDDTLVRHYGCKMWGTYIWHDHCTGAKYLSHRIIVLGLVDRKRRVMIPIHWEIMHRETETTSTEQDPSTKEHEKGWLTALRLLDETISNGFPKLSFVADSWFGCEEAFQMLTERGIDFVMEVRCNRKVVEAHRRKGIDIRVDQFFQGRARHNIYFYDKRRYAAEANLLFKDSMQKLKVVAVANGKNIASNPYAYYITNRLTWNASKVWGLWCDRWTIEVQFRELKQFFTLSEAAVRHENAVKMQIFIAMLALTVIRIEQCLSVGANEDQYVRPKPAGVIVRELITDTYRKSITKLAHEKRGKPAREKIATRLKNENLHTKPTEEKRIPKILASQELQREAA